MPNTKLKKRIGKLGGYTVSILILSWLAFTKGPGLIDSSSDGLVLLGAIVYILWVTAVAIVCVDIIRTVKKINRSKIK